MRSTAGFALSTASIFLAIVAVLIGSPALFYITTALIATIGGCHLQAYLAVRGLRIERIAPGSVRVGELITVELTISSLYKVNRTLVSIRDNLPARLAVSKISPSLPIAPAYDMPIKTQYQFRSLKRGRFTWSGCTVIGSDALGLVSKQLKYPTEPTEMLVLPRPIPVSIEIPVASGWGISEAESGQTRGAGIEPRGIRQYSSGDSLRHVHWRSTARTGQLLVKEFEAGSQAVSYFVLQTTKGTDVGEGASSSLELICGHAAFLAETFLRQGIRVALPGLDNNPSHYAPHERLNEIYHSLAEVQADDSATISEQVATLASSIQPGAVVFVMMTVADPKLPTVVSQLALHGTKVIPLLYDAGAFLKVKLQARYKTSTSEEFIGDLRAAGAMPTVMPIELLDEAARQELEANR